MNRHSDEWLRVFNEKGAIWRHGGNPRQPHAILTSDLHSDGCFKSECFTEDPILLNEAAQDLVQQFWATRFPLDIVDAVLGPAMGAITLSHDIARAINGKRRPGPICRSMYFEREVGPSGERMVIKRTNVRKGERILLCDDAITRGGTVEKISYKIANVEGIVHPYILVLVNRSGRSIIGVKRIISLVDLQFNEWKADDCPLCKVGSEAIRPKTPIENWLRLNERY